MKKTLMISMSLVTLMAGVALSAEVPAQPVISSHQPVSPASIADAGKRDMQRAHSMRGKGAEVPPKNELISGTVLETKNTGDYSYIYLQQKNGAKTWVAVTQMSIKVGSNVSFKPGVVMKNFESKALKQTFDAVVFSEGLATEADLKKQQEASAGSKGAIAGKAEKISVAKASGPNAITVVEAFTNGEKLNKKKVVVSGKVVKVSAGIMKRNWIHIQDGTGSAKKRTNSLVCTSKDMAQVGDVITVKGILAKDRDFGSGYSYKVIIENATFTK